MKKTEKVVMLLLMVTLALSMITGVDSEAKSKGYRHSFEGTIKVGGVKIIQKMYSYNVTKCKIWKVVKGKKILISKKTRSGFATNGKYLFYVKCKSEYSQNNSTFIRLNLKTGKKKIVKKGYSYAIEGASGKNIYAGEEIDAEGCVLYAFNADTLSSTFMTDCVGGVMCGNGKVLTSMNSGDVSNGPMYLFNSNGSNRKKIATGITGKIMKRKVYIIRCRYKRSGKLQYCAIRLNFNGKGKKVVRGWSSKYPKKYSPYY